MQHYVIALTTPESLAPLCESLLPCSPQLHLHLICNGHAEYTKAASFASFSITFLEGDQPADLLNQKAQDAAQAEHLIFFTHVARVFPGFFDEIQNALSKGDDFSGLMFRCLPNESQHHVDPVSLESPTLGGGACLVNRGLFLQAGGLDAAFPQNYMWDELSLRLRGLGSPIYYTPKAVANVPLPADTEAELNEEYLVEQSYSVLLALKYGSGETIRTAQRGYRQAIRSPRPFPNVRKRLLQQYWLNIRSHGRLKKWRREMPELFSAVQAQLPLGQSLLRGASPIDVPVTEGPHFTVVIRTHNRPSLLRGALQSLEHQTYPNFDIVVVEDGPPTAQSMVEKEFAHLPITYHATGENVGRSRAGNVGLALATGEYLNFLDDDDYFYPDHLEQMAAAAVRHPEADLLLGCSVSLFTDADSADASVRAAAQYTLVRFDRLDVFTMSQMCQIPLLSGVFKRTLFQQLGGLHEGMDAHEDWAMWLKYLAVAKRANPSGIDVPRATSIFLQPASQQEADRRLNAYRVFDDALFSDPDIRFTVSLADMRRFYDGMLSDIAHVKQLGQLDEFLERESRRDNP